MVMLAIPFFSMRLGSADAGSDPAGSTTRKAYDLLAKGFGPGYNGPLQLVAQVDNHAQQAAFTTVATARRQARAASCASPRRELIAGAGRQAGRRHRRRLPERLAPGRVDARTSLHRLRDHVVPASSEPAVCTS